MSLNIYRIGGCMKKSLVIFLVLITAVVPVLFASSAKAFVPFVETEQGFIAILSHTYQNGTSAADPGSDFDFRNEGGQELLFPFARYSVGATIAGKHRVWFTYQPLEIVTNVTFKETREIGEFTFAAETPMELKYGFPFYRMSYTYDLLNNYDNAILGVGAALQIRNASIVFKSIAGTATELYVSQNLGLVPALAIYSQYRFPFGLVLSADIAGTYASSELFNGANFEFEGSILDASLRMGYELPNGLELFGNVRFFGGTAKGLSQYGNTYWTESTEKYTKNNIASLTASVGATWYR